MNWVMISFPPINLWVVTDVLYFYSPEKYRELYGLEEDHY